VTNVVGFGAFALVGDGVEGLVHISELSDEPFENPRQVVQEGQSIKVRVLSVDACAHRLGLSMRRA
jgi:small subunit ribosomal protein S1